MQLSLPFRNSPEQQSDCSTKRTRLSTWSFALRAAPFALCAVLTALSAIAFAQTNAAAPPQFTLAGDRFKPLTWNEMTPAQKSMIEHLLSGARRGVGGPFNILLRSPEMGDLAQQFGASVRFPATLPPRLNEFAIILTARFWTAQYEWTAHRRAAAQAGLSEEIIQAVAAGKRPAKMAQDEEVVYNFCTEVLKTHQVSDATFQAAVKALGERGVVDVMGAMGWYQFVSMLLNVDRYPLGEGVQPELKPLP
jgi:4-carboxymuconolactone decarboxylase